MADGTLTTADQSTDHKGHGLSIYRDTMDNETALFLHKIAGIAALIRDATDAIGVNEPMPEGVMESVWVIQDLANAALRRAGAV
jgi:hypothetical protein